MFLNRLAPDPLTRLSGRIGIFLCSRVDVVPVEFVSFLRYTHALPEIILFVTIQSLKVPYVNQYQRVSMKRADKTLGVYWLIIKFGFAERERDIRSVIFSSDQYQDVLREARPARAENADGDEFDSQDIAFYVAKSLVSVDATKPLPHRVIAGLFSALSLAQEATAQHLQLPLQATIEVGSGVPI